MENYDALIIAVGAEPVIPKLPGIDKPHVHWAPKADLGEIEVGKRLLSSEPVQLALNVPLI